MRILPELLLITAGLSLGFFIASGLVALVIGLGIVTRYAGITKTAESLRFYECCCMSGALFGDLFSLGTFGLTRGLPFVILCMAAGKIAGSLYYFASGFQ